MRPESSTCRARNSKKKSLLPFLQIRLIYAVNGPNKLNISTNQRRRPRAAEKWAEPQRHGRRRGRGASVAGGGPGAPIDLSITQTRLLFLAMPRYHSHALALSRYPSVPLALSHYYSIPHALYRSLSLSLTITRFFTLILAPSGPYKVPLTPYRSF